MSVSDLDDPRAWPPPRAAAGGADIYDGVRRAIDAPTASEAAAFDEQARRCLASALTDRDGNALANAMANAPSAAVARHLRRLLADVERGDPSIDERLRNTLFAIPVVVVAALEANAAAATLDAILRDVAALAAMLRDAHAFGGSQMLALSPSLVAADAIDVAALPSLLAHGDLAHTAAAFAPGAVDLPPAPIRVDGPFERVHLRFIVGAVLTPPHADPLESTTIARWGTPFARALAGAWAVPGVSLLALPRDPQRLVGAVQSGRAAQREVSAQLFASNAIRALRRAFGEPTAIISAHRAADAPGRGELRLSISSPFAPKEAEGFRCPLYPYETVQEVGSMLVALVRDCRVTDVRVIPGVHDDIDPLTHGPLFFKSDALPPHASTH
jgi:hypothetical protein